MTSETLPLRADTTVVSTRVVIQKCVIKAALKLFPNILDYHKPVGASRPVISSFLRHGGGTRWPFHERPDPHRKGALLFAYPCYTLAEMLDHGEPLISQRESTRSFLVRWTLLSVFLLGGQGCMEMPNQSYSGPFLPLSEDEVRLRDRLEKHVVTLAGEIGERNIWHPRGLAASAAYIERALSDVGYRVERQEFTVEGTTVANLEAERTGTSSSGEIVIVGAHYDSVMGCPGANDNASGIAGLLELARLLATEELSRTVRFVAFVNEEPPFFLTGDMGSRVYASRSRHRGENVVAMLSLETIGYYSEDRGSQHYPFPFSFFYPNTANFIGFVGNFSSRRLVRQAIGIFRAHTQFPSEGLAAPEWVTGVGWSDHWSFWKEGYPAIMITDTALFRYDYYHTRQDTPERLDYDRTARVVMGLSRVVADLAGR